MCWALKWTRSKPAVECLGRAAQPLVPAAVEGEVALDEAGEVGARREADPLLVIAHPAVELGADEVEVLRSGAPLALADAVGVLAAQPGLDAVGVLVLAELDERLDPLLPDAGSRGCACSASVMLASR